MSDRSHLLLVNDSEDPVAQSWGVPLPLDFETSDQEPYPIDCLPDLIKTPIMACHEYAGQPLPLIASSALSTISLVVQHHIDVRRDDVLSGPTSLAFITIAESGERKSSADRLFSGPILDWQRAKREALKNEFARNRAEIQSWQAQIEGLEAQIKRGGGKTKAHGDSDKIEDLKKKLHELYANEPKKMCYPTLLSEVITMPALIKLLDELYPSTALWSDEAGTIVGSHGLKNEGAMEFLSVLNKLYDGSPFSKTTLTEGRSELWGKRLTINLMLQEVVFNKFLMTSDSVSRGGGFLARTLLCKPKSTAGNRTYKDPNGLLCTFNEFHNRLKVLLDESDGSLDSLRVNTKEVKLSDSSWKAWTSYVNQTEYLQASGKSLELHKDFAAKSPETACRLAACIQHFCERYQKELEVNFMEIGIQLAKWYLHEAVRIISPPKEKKIRVDARKLLSWFKTNPKECYRLTELLRWGPRSTRRKAECLNALKLLESHNYLIVSQPRKGTRNVTLNPTILDL